jgi:hypothetical protein
MNPVDFMKTVYLGDRGIKGYMIDSWNQIARLHITEISRVRSSDGQWHFYNEENLIDGRIVFEHIASFTIDPPGAVLDDFIEEEETKPYRDDQFYIRFSCGGTLGGNAVRATLEIIFKAMYLESSDGGRRFYE